MNRGSFLEHLGWTGSGIAFGLTAAGTFAPVAADAKTSLRFVQISDSHIGFSKPANDHVAETLQQTVSAINALAQRPAFVVHTGDITHLSKPAEFASARDILAQLKMPLITLPGEHDVIDNGAAYASAFGLPAARKGWSSFDQGGVHFVTLTNVASEQLGLLGTEQLDWLENDLGSRPASMPIVVFAHVPLYALYEAWGWTTKDNARALAALARFDAVTVLNGHIHQIIEHREGNIRFITAASTAYPQPKPGAAAAPGPLTVPPDHLLAVLGYRTVGFDGPAAPSVVDAPLG